MFDASVSILRHSVNGWFSVSVGEYICVWSHELSGFDGCRDVASWGDGATITGDIHRASSFDRLAAYDGTMGPFFNVV